MPAPISESVYISRTEAAIIGRITFHGLAEPFRGYKTKINLSCLSCGHEWVASFDNTIRGRGCPECARVAVGTIREKPESYYLDKISTLSEGKYQVLRRVGEFVGNKTMYRLKCLIDGYEWEANANNLTDGKGCNKCAGHYQPSPEEREREVDSIPGIRFIRWHGEGRTAHSKVVMECGICGGEFSSTITNLTKGRRCRRCSPKGFKISEPGTLYALRSKCQTMVKIGISNKPKQRHKILKRRTPFDWDCVDLVELDDGAAIARMEKELHQKMERIQFDEPFDGSTEWMQWDERVPQWFSDYRSQV